MPTNSYFQNFSESRVNEQLLYEDLLVESIKMNGHDCYYMPRETLGDTDNIFGENLQSHFDKAYQIEMYIINVEQHLGDQDFFSKFGLEIRDNDTLVVSRRSFEKYVPQSMAARPREGDLIYVPVMNKLLEIKFVEEESIFFTRGNKRPYVYELRCEAFRYSNETIDTGIEEIDQIDVDTSYTIELTVTGNGNFSIGETVYQGANLAAATATATVSNWDPVSGKLYLVNISGELDSNVAVTGVSSNTQNEVIVIDTMGDFVYYDSFDSKEIQDEANTFVDLSEINPFGLP
jgi:hypothetical protein